MTTNMVRKQIYIKKRQNELLKRLSKEQGLSEAEIIRQAIEQAAANPLVSAESYDQSAFEEFIALIEARKKTAKGGEPYRWNRDEIYAERESRWLRDQDQGQDKE